MSDFACVNGHSAGYNRFCPECGMPVILMDGIQDIEYDYYEEEEHAYCED